MSVDVAFAGLDAGFGGVDVATERDVERKRIGPESEPDPHRGSDVTPIRYVCFETHFLTCSPGSVPL